MDKVTKNKRGLELVTSCSSGYETSSKISLLVIYYPGFELTFQGCIVKNCEKNLLVLVSGSQWLGLRDKIFRNICILQIFLKIRFPKCKLRLLEPPRLPNLKMKMFYKRETLNPNNEEYSVKTIRFKLQYIIYGSTTTAIAKLISLANRETRVKSHFQLRSSLVL